MTRNSEAVRDLLDVVVGEDAQAVHVDARTAWESGRRRRIRQRLGVLTAAVVLLGLGVASIPLVSEARSVLAPASGTGAVASEHPRRLEHVYWDDELPQVTGPLAGVVQRNGATSGWYAVSPHGHLWRLVEADQGVPALSPNGSHLGYMRGSFRDAIYVIVNQLDGTVTTFPEIGTGGFDADIEDFDSDHRYFHSEQSPAFWSPDGTALLLRIGMSDPNVPEADPAAAVLRTDGTFVTLPKLAGSRGGANPVGWIDKNHVAFVESREGIPEVRVWIVDVRTGRAVRDFPLDYHAADYFASQWFGILSPDGNELAVGHDFDDSNIQFFSMRSATQGDLVDTLPSVPAAADICPRSWSSSDLYVPTTSADREDGAALVRARGGVTIVADPRLEIGCSTWARTALEGPPHQSWGSRFFGKDSTWLSWHWREVTLSVLLGLGLLLASALLARRRAGRI